ncbi:MAG: DUF4824 family protein [bacterium]|nr:DUF4824 family protein [bacterium]
MGPRMRRVLILTAAALLLIAAANGLLLWNVASNRAGEPEAELLLTERELLVQPSWREENSGRFLGLHYQYVRNIQDGAGRQANPWLDKAKLQTIGYRFRKEDAGRETKDMPRYPRKAVYLVLELDGAAYQQALAQAAAEVESLRLAGKAEQLQSASERLQQARDKDSRLFVVDAGLDAQALRQRYPNRQQYAIVPGYVRIWWLSPWQGLPDQEKRPRLSSHLSIAHDQIFVPLEYAGVFADIDGRKDHGRSVGKSPVPKFQVRLAFGQRLEPWIREMRAGQAEP